MNKFLELQSKYVAKMDRNKTAIEELSKKIENSCDYEKMRYMSEQVRLQIANLDYMDFLSELKILEAYYKHLL